MVSTILNHTPLDFGYDTPLWTCRMVAELLQQEFAVTVSDATIRLHLQRLRLTPQKPSSQDSARDAAEIESFLNDKFIRIQRLAKKIGADIGFEDESGVMTPSHRGTTWGKAGETPVVKASSQRGRDKVLSVVMPDGTLRYSIREGTINETVFINYLQHLLQPRQRPLILLLDRARFHGSKAVRAWVRQHRKQLQIYFLPRHAPELNPDEQVWNEIKNNQLRKQAIKNKVDLKKRLRAALAGLQRKTQRVTSFFHMPDTKYVLQEVSFVS
jgi:transposase